ALAEIPFGAAMATSVNTLIVRAAVWIRGFSSVSTMVIISSGVMLYGEPSSDCHLMNNNMMRRNGYVSSAERPEHVAAAHRGFAAVRHPSDVLDRVCDVFPNARNCRCTQHRFRRSVFSLRCSLLSNVRRPRAADLML